MAENLALLIGPSYAADLPTFCGPLEGVENDLQIMKDMLCRNGFHPQNIKVLEGQMASQEDILYSLEELSFKAQKGSVVVVFFAGHGYEIPDTFDQGLIPANLTKEMVNKYHIYDKCITGEHFKPHLSKLIKKGALVNVIFDCCFSGHMYRGYSEKHSSSTRGIRQLALSDNYISEHCKILKSRGNPVEHEEEHSIPAGVSSPVQETQPGDSDEPMDHAPLQDTEPPNPMSSSTILPYPVQEFWTPLLKSEGWSPEQNDNFIFIGASAANERAYEWEDPRTGVYGSLTSVLVEVINEVQPGKRISYNTLKSLIRQKFAERRLQQQQTPQFEFGNMNLVLFSFDTVPPPPISFEVKEVEIVNGFTSKAVLNAGWLQGVVDGEYDIYDPRLTDDIVGEYAAAGYCVARIDITKDNIHEIESYGAVMFSYMYASDVKVGCKARLSLRGSMYYPVCITAAVVETAVLDDMKLALESQQMFSVMRDDSPDCVKLDLVPIEGKSCWRAIYEGRMIVPYQPIKDEHLMAKNLSKFFRVKFGILPREPDHKILRNVSFKVFKVENVTPFKNNPDKKTELKALAVQTPDVFEGRPECHIPTFQAHKVELVTTSYHRTKYQVVDGTGDAIVIQITNNNIQRPGIPGKPIHVCVISYQADGSIVVLYPASKRGVTGVLKPGETVTEIRRVLLHPDTVRRMVEPDFDVKRPDGCNDVIMLYATTAETDYEPLLQTAIELSPHLSTRGIDTPDGLRLETVSRFRDALESKPLNRNTVRDRLEWLTLKREIRVLYHQDQTP